MPGNSRGTCLAQKRGGWVARKVPETPRKHQTTVVKTPPNDLKKNENGGKMLQTIQNLRKPSPNEQKPTTTKSRGTFRGNNPDAVEGRAQRSRVRITRHEVTRPEGLAHREREPYPMRVGVNESGRHHGHDDPTCTVDAIAGR